MLSDSHCCVEPWYTAQCFKQLWRSSADADHLISSAWWPMSLLLRRDTAIVQCQQRNVRVTDDMLDCGRLKHVERLPLRVTNTIYLQEVDSLAAWSASPAVQLPQTL